MAKGSSNRSNTDCKIEKANALEFCIEKVHRRNFLSSIFSAPSVLLLAGNVSFSGQGLCSELDSFQNSSPLLNKKTLKNKTGFSFEYPDDFIIAINRDEFDKSKTESQTLALVGNFSKFDTVSIIAYPKNENISFFNFDDVTSNFLTAGNMSTEVKYKVQSEGRFRGDDEPFWLIEYVTSTCRGKIEEMKGGMLDCISPVNGTSIPSITRHHLSLLIFHNDAVYVINASSLDNRWELMHDKFLSSIYSFSFN